MSTETLHKCEVCGSVFDNAKALAGHKSNGHDQPWRNEELLRKMYVEDGLSPYELADKWECDSKTVRNWLHKYGFDLREAKEYNRVEYVAFNHHNQGYERWQHHYGKDRGVSVFVHRLLAVSEYGLDAVRGKHIHHENNVPWDNRPDNIEPKDPSEHIKEHYEQGDYSINTAATEMQNEL